MGVICTRVYHIEIGFKIDVDVELLNDTGKTQDIKGDLGFAAQIYSTLLNTPEAD